MTSFNFKNQKGQMMLLSVLVLSGIIASVTALAGLLISFQLRQVTDARQSLESIFAADAGIECILFREFGISGATTTCPNPGSEYSFPNGSKFSFRLVSDTGTVKTWISLGHDSQNRTARALQIQFIRR